MVAVLGRGAMERGEGIAYYDRGVGAGEGIATKNCTIRSFTQ